MKFNLQIVIFIFIVIALQENSFAAARRVKNVSNVLTIKKEMADSDPKEIERIGRKLSGESKKVASHSVGNRKGEEENSIMAFSSDYHPPKPHPPKNN